jgi:hypothetical protein
MFTAIAAIKQNSENSYRFIKRSEYSTSQMLVRRKRRLEQVKRYSGITQNHLPASPGVDLNLFR